MTVPPLPIRQAEFVGSAKDDLSAFPASVKLTIGHALFLAQVGGKHRKAKPLRGDAAFKGAGTLEVVEDFDGDTYRTVYHVKLGGVIYVLHAFQKKSKSGISTPKHDIDLIKERLSQARAHYQEHYREKIE